MMPLLTFAPTLPITRYRFTFTWQNRVRLPEYTGSTLRGVFGHALLAKVCLCGQHDQHHPQCPYPSIFATPATQKLNDPSQQNTPPQPYVIEPPTDGKTHYQAGDTYTFNMILFGSTRLLLPLLVSVWEHAFAQGIGADKGRGELHSVVAEQTASNQHDLILPTHYSSQYTLHFYTPLRIQQHSKICHPHQLNHDILLRQVLRRVSTIAKLHFPQAITGDFAQLAQQTAHVSGSHQLIWQEGKRYSNRQKHHIPLGGVLGDWQLQDVPPDFAALLHIGQWLHIGKETVFGCGGYHLQAA